MAPDRTELEWLYKPADLLERSYEFQGEECELVIHQGRAVATFRVPTDSISAELKDEIRSHINNVLAARQIQVRRRFNIDKHPRVIQHEEDGKDLSVTVDPEVLGITGHAVDIVLTDAGAIVRDTRAERMTAEAADIARLSAKAQASPTMRRLLESFTRSVEDPSNEFLYLYEVRDALKAHFGNANKAKTALRITSGEWDRLGKLANFDPIDQGRHRGNHPHRRPATEVELAQARVIVQRWIRAFAALP